MIEVLANATMALYCNIQVYQINMFCAINLHSVICQVYFNRKTYNIEKGRARRSSTFPKMHSEFSQEVCKGKNIQRMGIPDWQLAVRVNPHTVPYVPFLCQIHVEFRSHSAKPLEKLDQGKIEEGLRDN